MKLSNLISKGYFCEELPPPFTTKSLAQNLTAIQKTISKLSGQDKKQLKETSFVRFSVVKSGMHRRQTGVPNPYHQILLSESIVSNWKDIKNLYKKSKISASVPVIDKTGRRALAQLGRFDRFKEKCIEASYDMSYELVMDISKYFPNIYTHSIPWSIHTKAVAKKNRNDLKLLGNLLDKSVRDGQHGQTKGIPIGTDTSRIIAELIGCSIDDEFKRRLKKESIELRGHRFVDDCHFFYSTRAEAETALKIYQTILYEYSLELNEEKTIIKETPCCFENTWVHTVIGFHIRYDPIYQRLDLRNYANLLISLSIQNPKESVIKYGIKKIAKVPIVDTNWSLYEALIYKLTMAEPLVLPELLEILLKNKPRVKKTRLKLFIDSILKQNIFKGNHYEIAWALWIANSFKVRITKIHAQAILDSGDVISSIIILDMRSKGLISGVLKLSLIMKEFTPDNLTSELWLLIYEASVKGWVKSTVLSKIKFFEELNALGVSFYNPTNQISVGKSNIYGPKQPVKSTPGKKQKEITIY